MSSKKKRIGSTLFGLHGREFGAYDLWSSSKDVKSNSSFVINSVKHCGHPKELREHPKNVSTLRHIETRKGS
jgi:hypothetical protein